MTRARRAWSVVVLAAVHFYRDRASQHAAAVAFYSLLALAPLLYLFGRALRAVVPETTSQGDVVSGFSAFLPPHADGVLRQLAASLPRGDAVAALAVPALLYVAGSAFSALELAVNVAFGTDDRMRFWLSRLKAFAGVSALAVLLLVALVVDHATVWLTRVQAAAGVPRVGTGSLGGLSQAGLLLVSYFAFLLLYKVLPRAKVAWRSAAVGALVAVVLWEASRHVFAALLARSPAYGLLTGVLAAAVAFLLWVYTAALITLFGAEITAKMNGAARDGSATETRKGAVS